MNFIIQYVREGSLFLGVAAGSYFLSLKIWDFIRKLMSNQKRECDVLLCNGEQSIKVKALIDTGNHLRDPLTGKAVSIIGKETCEILWQQNNIHDFRFISYHTIGKRDGMMPLFVLERMCLYLEEEYWIEKPLIAVSQNIFGKGIYKMILSPDV